jgi:hypothetical protein
MVTAPADKQQKPSLKGAFAYAGLATSPLRISGLEDLNASDWQDFGTGAREGRIDLPLQGANTDGTRWGGRLGYRLVPAFPVLAELGVFPGKALLLTFALGVDLHPLRSKSFSLGVTPKIGYMVGIIDLGNAHVLPGKTPPIVTRAGTFQEGDSVSAMLSGLFGQLAVTSNLKVFGPLGVRLEAGYQLAAVGNFKIKAGGVELDKNAPALVKADGSTRQAGIDPKGKASGPYGGAALTLEL